MAATLTAGAFVVPGWAQEFEMKVGFVTFRDQQHQYALFLEEEIEAATNGRIDVQVFPRGELGPIPQQIEGTQLGTQAMYIAPTDFFAGVDSRFGVFSVPTLFKSKAHAAATLLDPELSVELRELGSGKNLQVAAVFIHSAAHYMAKEPLGSLDDFDGLKMRINATDAERAKMAVFGATGIPMPLGEVLPALQRGEIDGTMSGIAIYANLGFADFSKTLLRTEDQMIVSAAALSPVWLATLPDDLQAVVVEISEGLLGRITEWSLAADVPLEAKWAEQGGEIVDISEDEKARLVAALADIGDQVTEGDVAARTLLNRVREVSAKY
ncbi:MAG: TRAP transporter substrate-binding protein [Alphaproteobacteria bacterium]